MIIKRTTITALNKYLSVNVFNSKVKYQVNGRVKNEQGVGHEGSLGSQFVSRQYEALAMQRHDDMTAYNI